MRKRYKEKRRSCALCKPNKTGHAKRFTEKELDATNISEKVIHSLQDTDGESLNVADGAL